MKLEGSIEALEGWLATRRAGLGGEWLWDALAAVDAPAWLRYLRQLLDEGGEKNPRVTVPALIALASSGDRSAAASLSIMFSRIPWGSGLEVHLSHADSDTARVALHQRTAAMRALVRSGEANLIGRALRADGKDLLTASLRSPSRASAARILTDLLTESPESFSAGQLRYLARAVDPMTSISTRWEGELGRVGLRVDYSEMRDAAALALAHRRRSP